MKFSPDVDFLKEQIRQRECAEGLQETARRAVTPSLYMGLAGAVREKQKAAKSLIPQIKKI